VEARIAQHAAAMDGVVTNYRKEVVERKRLFNLVQELRGNIRVFVRVRPVSSRELRDGASIVVTFPGENEIALVNERGVKKRWEFDQVFQMDSEQQGVYKEVSPLVTSMLDGFNVCIFAYGQTGSGKTFTMSGEGGDGTLLGLMPRAVYEMYSILERHSEDVEASVQFCMTELYKDHLEDLLLEQRPGESNSAFTQRRPELKVKMDPNGIVFIDGVTMADAPTAQELQQLIEAGTAHRHTSATLMNAESSRSHLLMSVYIRSRNKATRVDTVGKLTLVDLAGSERMGKSGVTGDAAKEAVSINKSLSALGDVIGALTKGAKHVPYRNHTLTRLMQDSLGGNAKTLMVVNCSPADYNFDETQNSLAYVPASAHIRHPWCAIA
jgi:kinesin family protein C2/C3